MKHDIAVASGDGIGPEIMAATLDVLKSAGANLQLHPVIIGETLYKKGILTGIEPQTWETIRRCKAFLKAPVTTPQGGGFKSLNVTIRTTLGLFANIRPAVSYAPFIATKHPQMDVVIVRENEEDLYMGLEYQQTPSVACSHKIISWQGSEKIIRYAFEYARLHGRKKVTCFVKDNIMKLSDGLFHQAFRQIALEYPDIGQESWIVDIGAAKLADSPENFDVIVMPNLYGDILSDVAAEISGSVGLAGSANIGRTSAMFEAIHGSAPRRAGQDVANPSGLLLASVMMLAYLGESALAECIHNAWLVTLEEGIHTYDVFHEAHSKKKVGTREFAKAVCANLGKTPRTLKAPMYGAGKIQASPSSLPEPATSRKLVGVDVFIYTHEDVDSFQKRVASVQMSPLKLQMITNRGARVWPEGYPETFCIEQMRCRFTHETKGQVVTYAHILEVLKSLHQSGFDLIKTENLYLLGEKAGFSSADG